MAPVTSAEAFGHAISTHSQTSSKDTLYPGDDYFALARHLSEDRGSHSPLPGAPPFNFVVIRSLVSGEEHSTTFDGHEDFFDFEHASVPDEGARLVFLRGFPTAQWLKEIGYKHNVDPELYRRHLRFQSIDAGARDYFTSPCLPSASTDILQLTISTICSKDTIGQSAGSDDMERLRRTGVESLMKYHEDLRQNVRVGDSVVRKYHVLSKQYCIIEQTISISITKLENSWTAMILLDNGRDLSLSPPGPWFPTPNEHTWGTYIHPVTLHHEKLALLPWVTQSHGYDPPTREFMWEASQNACLLPLQYGRLLDKEVVGQDCLYALHEIFKFAASSELQFLNLLQTQVDLELSSLKLRNNALVNLRYITKIVGDHVTNLAANVTLLRARETSDWPRATDCRGRAIADKKAALLQCDFEYLQGRAEKILLTCQHSIDALVSDAVFQESVKAVENAKRVERLTLLATVFIPLNFTCALFGMNVVQFGTGKVELWWFFVSAVLIVAASLALYNFRTPRYFHRLVGGWRALW